MLEVHYQDHSGLSPNQPLVPSTHAVIIDDASGAILLHKREDHSLWAFPGGKMNPGESLEESLKREIREELGVEISIEKPVTVYSSPEYLLSVGEVVVQPFLVVFLCRIANGSLKVTEESVEYLWIQRGDIDSVEAFPLVKEIASLVWSGEKVILWK